MKAVTYARVSTKEQEETGYSLPAQKKLLEDYADRKSLQISRMFSISESASGKKQREIFAQMLGYVKKHKINIIICEKVDRITRNLKEAVEVNEWLEEDEERHIHSVKDGIVLHKNSRSQEKFNWNIRIVMAQNYIDNLSEEVKKGQREKIAQGWYPTAPPLGYKSDGIKGRRIHLPDPETAPLVKKLFELYAKRLCSMQGLADYALKSGLRSRHNKALSKSRIYDLITNSYYYGKFKWNGVLYQGKHEPIISEELFMEAQRVLTGKSNPRNRAREHLFRGLMKCKECGGTICWEEHKNIVYGHCNHYKQCSQKVWHKEKDINAEILIFSDNFVVKNKRVAEWIRKALKEHHKEEIENRAIALNELDKAHDLLVKRLDRLYDDKLDNVITEDTYKRKFTQYSEEKELVAESIEKQSKAGTKYYELGMLVYELSQEAKNIYERRKDPNKKRALLNIIFESMTLSDEGIEFQLTPAFAFLKKAIEATNSSKLEKIIRKPAITFEPVKFGFTSEKTGVLVPACSIWRPGADSNRRPPQ